MADFISQSIPITPPSIETPEITQPKNKSDPQYFMNNERNVWLSIFVGCAILVMATFIPLQFANVPMFNWVGVVLSLIASVVFGSALYNYKRNLDAGEINEEAYIDWSKSSMLIYTVGGVLFIVTSMVMYELYWNASRSSPGKIPEPIIEDDVRSVKSFGSVKSAKSLRSAKSTPSLVSDGSR